MQSPSFADYYAAHKLDNLFRLEPGDTAAALATPRNADRPALAAALRDQAERLGAPAEVFASLERLAESESRVVVTGQQTGFLLGPLYTLSKAVSAIALAARLNTDDKPVVPVFWLASQDADSAEIDHTYLLDYSERLHRVSVPLPEGVAAGHIPFEDQFLETALEAAETFGGPEPYRDEVVRLLRETAACSRTFADWFAAILYRLLGHTGLIVMNPLEPEVARLFRPVLEAELAEPLRSSAAINEAAEALRERGFTPQLGRAAGATNLFLEEDGQRHLLRFDGKAFSTDTASYTREDLLKRLEEDPASLTPAAGLRPITQDAALPNVATVVGPGELRYFAQLKGVYEAHGVPMSLVWPRTTATVLEPPVSRILEKFDLTAAQVQSDFSGVKADKLLELHGHKLAFDNRLRALKNLTASMKKDVSGIDPTLERTVARAGETLEEIFGKLEAKSAAALGERDDTYTRQFARLAAHLLPNGTPQERLISPFSFFLKFGVENVMKRMLELPAEGDHILKF